MPLRSSWFLLSPPLAILLSSTGCTGAWLRECICFKGAAVVAVDGVSPVLVFNGAVSELPPGTMVEMTRFTHWVVLRRPGKPRLTAVDMASGRVADIPHTFVEDGSAVSLWVDGDALYARVAGGLNQVGPAPVFQKFVFDRVAWQPLSPEDDKHAEASYRASKQFAGAQGCKTEALEVVTRKKFLVREVVAKYARGTEIVLFRQNDLWTSDFIAGLGPIWP